MANFNCVDVSEWNGSIDWNKAKAAGVDYAFIRAGFGQDYTKQDDKYFASNMDKAIAAGVKVGVYFYSYATTADGARGEAKHCLRLIEPYKNKMSFPIFYDVEESKIAGSVKTTIPAFISALNAAGYNCGVYASAYWFNNYFKGVTIPFRWVASWGSDDGKPHTKPDNCDVWQYTSRGSVSGIGNGGVDCDILYNTSMTALIGGSSEDDQKDDDQKDDQQGGEIVNVSLHVLRKGDQGGEIGGEILTIQMLLNEIGFRDQNGAYLKLDRIFGAKTEYAVKNYQRARGLTVDGVVGFETWNRILK